MYFDLHVDIGVYIRAVKVIVKSYYSLVFTHIDRNESFVYFHRRSHMELNSS